MPRIAWLKSRMATPLRGEGTSSGVFRFSVAYFLVALVLLYVTLPFVQSVRNGILIEAVLMTLVLLSAVLAVSGRRRALIGAMVFAVPALVEKWVNYWWPDLLPPQVSLWTGLAFIGFIVLRLLSFILRAPRVNSEILCAGVLIPDSFAFTGGLPSSRSLEGFNSLYFSITTLATSGYGDIMPVSGLARMLAMMESVAGLLYVAVLIARLVSLYSSQALADDLNAPTPLDRNQLEAPADDPESGADSQRNPDADAA